MARVIIFVPCFSQKLRENAFEWKLTSFPFKQQNILNSRLNMYQDCNFGEFHSYFQNSVNLHMLRDLNYYLMHCTLRISMIN